MGSHGDEEQAEVRRGDVEADVPSWLVEVPFAHRGLHAPGTPENSLAAFAAAADAGYGIELDVHRSADGHVVVTHDDDLSRVTGAVVSVAASPLEDIARLALADTDERIPTLAQVLEVVAGRVPIMVEVKNPRRTAGPLESGVTDVLDAYAGPVCVASFNPRTVGWFARYAPHLLRGQTASSFDGVEAPWLAKRMLAAMVANRWTRPDFVSYDLTGLPNRVCDRWRDRGRPLLTWTVTTPQDLVKARVVADNLIFEGVAL